MNSPAIAPNALVWLLVAQVLVIAPFLGRLPPWLAALWLGCALWRVRALHMRATYPRAWTKLLLMLGVGVAIYATGHSRFGLEAASALLIAAFILKLVEMRSHGDALVVIYLGFVVVATGYLFDSGMPAALYSLLPVTALLAALIGLQGAAGEHPWPTLRLAGGLLLQALPLMLLLFVTFPRVAPLWSMPQAGPRGVTGLAERMAPGDIVELGRSGALAFRARFDGPPPARSALYWRALTLEQFDGRAWSQVPADFAAGEPDWQARGEPLRYSILMQPSDRPWLFALDVAQTSLPGVRLGRDFRLEHARPVVQPLFYPVTSWPAALREPGLSAATRQRALQLPTAGNPQARAWATHLRRAYPEPAALVQALLEHFNREPFGYTLRPPRVGAHIVDDFLFASRQGFCAHYAGAMTFVLRAAGIPARVVAGYQGGEYQAAGNDLTVRQLDAHAWVEYWLPGEGWTRVDPTFEVAPQRIELGAEQALADERGVLDGAPRLPGFLQIGWLNDLRRTWDGANHGWHRWVLGYQGEEQARLLHAWFAGFAPGAVVGLLAGAALGVALLARWLFRPRRREEAVELRLFARFERLLAGRGVVRQPGEGARAYACRAALALPAQSEAILGFMQVFEAWRYAGERGRDGELRRALRRVRRALPWRPGAGLWV